MRQKRYNVRINICTYEAKSYLYIRLNTLGSGCLNNSSFRIVPIFRLRVAQRLNLFGSMTRRKLRAVEEIANVV